jgi:hypothetical protein
MRLNMMAKLYIKKLEGTKQRKIREGRFAWGSYIMILKFKRTLKVWCTGATVEERNC